MMNSTLGLFSWTFSAPFLYVLTNHWISQGFSERQLWNSTKVQILEVLGSIVTEKSQHTIIKFPMCSIVRRSNSYNIHTNAVQFAPALVTEKKWTIEVAQKKLKSLHWLYFKISAVLFMTINSSLSLRAWAKIWAWFFKIRNLATKVDIYSVDKSLVKSWIGDQQCGICLMASLTCSFAARTAHINALKS